MRSSLGGRARGRAPTHTHTDTEQPLRARARLGDGGERVGRSKGRVLPGGRHRLLNSVQPVVVTLPPVHVTSAADEHGQCWAADEHGR